MCVNWSLTHLTKSYCIHHLLSSSTSSAVSIDFDLDNDLDMDCTPSDKCSQKNPTANTPTAQPPMMPVLEVETPCTLMLPKSGVENSGELVEVAYGDAQPNKEGKTMHFRPLEDGHISVSVETIVSGFEDTSIPVPLPNVGLEKLGDARGSFIAWPCAWVKFSEEVLKKCNKTNEKEPHPNKEGVVQGNGMEAMEKVKSSKGSSKQIKAKERSLVPVHVLENLTKACLWLHKCVSIMDDLNPIVVEVEQGKFNYLKDTNHRVYPIDVGGFLSGLNYNVSILQVFMSALQEELSLSGKGTKVGWLCPEEIRDNACFYSVSDVVAYLEWSIAKSIEAKHNYILAPYLEDQHWLLLCICPLTHTIYQLDPYCPQGSHNALLVKSLLNGVMKKLKGSGSSKRLMFPQWKPVKCATASEERDSGLYVMRVMHDLVKSCTQMVDDKVIIDTQKEGPYTVDELNEVRDMFARFLANFCIA